MSSGRGKPKTFIQEYNLCFSQSNIGQIGDTQVSTQHTVGINTSVIIMFQVILFVNMSLITEYIFFYILLACQLVLLFLLSPAGGYFSFFGFFFIDVLASFGLFASLFLLCLVVSVIVGWKWQLHNGHQYAQC